VCGGERLSYLTDDPGGVVRRQAAVLVDEGGEVGARDVLHDQPLLLALGDEVEDGDDVRVVEPCRQRGLSLGTREPRRVTSGELADALDRDLATQHLVDREPHGSHAAVTDLALQDVASTDRRHAGSRTTSLVTPIRLRTREAPD
jgi:hypothetical protein